MKLILPPCLGPLNARPKVSVAKATCGPHMNVVISANNDTDSGVSPASNNNSERTANSFDYDSFSALTKTRDDTPWSIKMEGQEDTAADSATTGADSQDNSGQYLAASNAPLGSQTSGG